MMCKCGKEFDCYHEFERGEIHSNHCFKCGKGEGFDMCKGKCIECTKEEWDEINKGIEEFKKEHNLP